MPLFAISDSVSRSSSLMRPSMRASVMSCLWIAKATPESWPRSPAPGVFLWLRAVMMKVRSFKHAPLAFAAVLRSTHGLVWRWRPQSVRKCTSPHWPEMRYANLPQCSDPSVGDTGVGCHGGTPMTAAKGKAVEKEYDDIPGDTMKWAKDQ